MISFDSEKEFQSMLLRKVKLPQLKSKYGNKRVEAEGKVFDSKGEYNRFLELKLEEKTGIIRKLRHHVIFELQKGFSWKGTRMMAINYEADFVYDKKGVTVIEDFKGGKNGVRTKEYLIKKKLLLSTLNQEKYEFIET